ncbi:MAG: heavy metal translocating P-type ATPase, partial [candidate division Zixibacteria bacterium]
MDGKNSRCVLKISGMDCPDCALAIEKDIAAQPGIKLAKVDFVGNLLTVDGDGIELSEIRKRVRSLGYEATSSEESGLKRTSLLIPDMDCPDEERIIRKALNSVKTVSALEFDLVGRRVIVSHATTASTLLDAIQGEGFEARVMKSGRMSMESPISTWKIWSVAISAILVVIGGIIHLSDGPEYLYKGIILAGTIVGGWKIGQKGFVAARRLRLDMNFLMSAAVIGAIIINQWVEAGTVIVLFAIAGLLESFSLDRSRKAIKSLMDLSPQTARVIRDGQEIEIPVEEVNIGEKTIVKPGERIPVDGNVLSGSSAVNQAAITGETMPVTVAAGETVYAGTINGEGALEIETSHIAGDTTIDRIIKLVEEARTSRAPTQGFVERFSRVYTPAVVGISVIVAVIPPLLIGLSWSEWIYRALALLVIACPCALVISTPVTIVSALTAAAHNGVLIKGGAYLENLHRIKAIAFDKTGTITRGVPGVREVSPVNNIEKEELLRLAASLEKRSEHPIASAIVEHATLLGIDILPVDDFQSIPGKGATGTVSGVKYFIGKDLLFEEMGIRDEVVEKLLDRVENESQTAVLVGTEKQVLGIIAISDEIRPDSATTIAELRKFGIEKIIMLTGDNHRTAEAVGKAAGIEDIRGELLPEQKVEAIKGARSETGSVVMVGDGIN